MTEGQKTTNADETTTSQAQPTEDYKAKFEHQQELNRKREGQIYELQQAVKKYEGVDIDGLKSTADKYKEMIASKGTDDEKQALFEAEKARLLADNESAQKALNERLNATNSKLKEYEVVNTVMDKIADSFTTDGQKIVRDMIRKEMDIDENGNIFRKGQDGKPMYINGSTLFGIEEMKNHILSEYPSIEADKQISGGKTQGNVSTTTANSGSTPAYPSGFANLPQKEKEAWFRANPNALPPVLE